MNARSMLVYLRAVRATPVLRHPDWHYSAERKRKADKRETWICVAIVVAMIVGTATADWVASEPTVAGVKR